VDLVLISDQEPTNHFTGKVWIQPGITGQKPTSAFMKLGGTYIQIATTNLIPFIYKRITYLLDGIDISDYVEKYSCMITDVLTTEVDTCTFTLTDDDGNHKPQVGQEFTIFYKPTSTSLPVIRFSGRITQYDQSRYSVGKYKYNESVSDFTQDLNKNLINKSYTGQTMGYIIRDIIQNYAPSLGTFNIPTGPVIDFIQYSYVFPYAALTELAQLAGYDWYVDYEKQVQFILPSEIFTPYNLTETGDVDNEEYSDLSISIDKSSLINTQKVRGGYELSDDYTQIWIVQAGQTELPIAYHPYSAASGAIELYINTGAGYGAKITPGIDNIDTTSDYVVNFSEKVLKDQNNNWVAGYAVKLIYKYQIPILSQASDDDSIELMKNYEGGDGIYEGELIVDETILTRTAARTKAQAVINLHSTPILNGSFNTTKYGYRSGQTITLNLPSRALTGTYLIHSVTAQPIGSGEFSYNVVFSNNYKDLSQFLMSLYDRSQPVFIRSDEVLDTLKVVKETNTISIVSTPILTTQPKWSNDEGTTEGAGRYGLCEFS
jgi:hypothetical protein